MLNPSDFSHGHQISASLPIMSLKADLVKGGDYLAMVLDNSTGNNTAFQSKSGVMTITPAHLASLTKQNVPPLVLSNLISQDIPGSNFFNCIFEVCRAGEPIGFELVNGVETPIVSKSGSTVYTKDHFRILDNSRDLQLSEATMDDIESLIAKVNEQLMAEQAQEMLGNYKKTTSRRKQARLSRNAFKSSNATTNTPDATNDAIDNTPEEEDGGLI